MRLLYLIFAFLLINLTSCGKDEGKEKLPEGEMIGVWKLSKSYLKCTGDGTITFESLSDCEKTSQMTFGVDRSLNIMTATLNDTDCEIAQWDGTWYIPESNLLVREENGISTSHEFSLVDDTLTFRLDRVRVDNCSAVSIRYNDWQRE